MASVVETGSGETSRRKPFYKSLSFQVFTHREAEKDSIIAPAGSKS